MSSKNSGVVVLGLSAIAAGVAYFFWDRSKTAPASDTYIEKNNTYVEREVDASIEKFFNTDTSSARQVISNPLASVDKGLGAKVPTVSGEPWYPSEHQEPAPAPFFDTSKNTYTPTTPDDPNRFTFDSSIGFMDRSPVVSNSTNTPMPVTVGMLDIINAAATPVTSSQSVKSSGSKSSSSSVSKSGASGSGVSVSKSTAPASTVTKAAITASAAVMPKTSAVVSAVSTVVKSAAPSVASTVSKVADTVKSTVSNVTNSVKNTVSSALSSAKSTLSKLFG